MPFMKQQLKTSDHCPQCGKFSWTWIPDSLAQSCKCGYVRVYDDDGMWSAGASLQEWLKDIQKHEQQKHEQTN